MKKAFITLLVALAALCSAWAGTPSKINSLARQYRSQDGFEVVQLGRLALSGIRSVALMSKDLDAEDRAALKAFKGIKHITIVDFEEASEAEKTRFCQKLDRILDKMELILEARDSTESVRIYGVDDGKRIKDVVLLSSDGDLISVSGSVDLDQLGSLMEIAK